jgi:hypothetical protein
MPAHLKIEEFQAYMGAKTAVGSDVILQSLHTEIFVCRKTGSGQARLSSDSIIRVAPQRVHQFECFRFPDQSITDAGALLDP